MKTYIRPLIIVLVVLLTTALVAGWYNYSSAQSKTQDWEGLAKHLTVKGVKMYGAYWCHVCIQQKKLFGDTFQYVTYVESSTPDGKNLTDVAKVANITAFPTWIFPDGSRNVGLMTYDELANKSEYSPPQQ